MSVVRIARVLALAATAIAACSLIVGAAHAAARPSIGRVSWSAATDHRPLVASFAAVNGTTYAVTASRGRRTVRGRCGIRSGRGTCTIVLRPAGSWRVAITPKRQSATGESATATVSVQPAMASPAPGGSAPTCYASSNYSDTTGVFTVNANYFSQTSTYAIADDDTQITSLTVYAALAGTSSSNPDITTSSRSFTVGFSGATTGTFSQTLTGMQAPWTTSTGTAYRSLAWDVADTGYGAAGEGRIRVNGAGTLATWNSTQYIRVQVGITGTMRVPVACS